MRRRGSTRRIALVVVIASVVLLGGAFSVAHAVGFAPADNGSARDPIAVTPDGMWVAYDTFASNLAFERNPSSNAQIVLQDMRTGRAEIISRIEGVPGNGDSYDPSISDDGRYVVFTSEASDLVPGDTNGVADVFLYDRWAGSIKRVSVPSYGGQGDNDSHTGRISGDGSTIAFTSRATNLLPSVQTGGKRHVYSYKVSTKALALVSASASGVPADSHSFHPAISSNGKFIAFESTASNLAGLSGVDRSHIYWRDMGTSDVVLVSQKWVGGSPASPITPGNRDSYAPSISANGSRVVYSTAATNILNGVDDNNWDDIYGWDKTFMTTHWISRLPGGSSPTGNARTPTISSNGETVYFLSNVTNFKPNPDMNTYLYRAIWGDNSKLQRIDERIGGGPADGGSSHPRALDHGVVFRSDATNIIAGDTNDNSDVFLYDADFGIDIVSQGAVLQVFGTTQLDTSAAVARAAFPFGTKTVIVTKGDFWADALAGAPLAGVLDAPILLAVGDSLAPSVKAVIEDFQPTRVVILGGERAVRPAIENEIKALSPAADIERIAGSTHYDTADLIAERVLDAADSPYDGTAIFATGHSPYDALSGSPIAARRGVPIFLVDRTAQTLTPGAESAIQAGQVKRTIALGGQNSLPDRLYQRMPGSESDGSRIRLFGTTWAETSVRIAEWITGPSGTFDLSRVGFARGDKPYDALAGSVLQAKNGAILLTVEQTALPTSTKDFLYRNGQYIGRITYFGGEGAIRPAVRDGIEATLVNPAPL